MKKSAKTLYLPLLWMFMFYAIQSSKAQFNYIDPTNASYPLPYHDLVQSTKKIVSFMGGTGGPPSTALTAFGINTETPNHLLDVQGGDVNVGCSTCTSSNEQGYMIGDQYVVWNNGNNENIYIGQNAAGGVGTNPLGQYNTVVGYTAGQALGSAVYAPIYQAQDNTLIGSVAGNYLRYGMNDTYVGYAAGKVDVQGQNNTFLGAFAGNSTTGSVTIPPALGDYNTMTGFVCGYTNTTGKANNYYGKAAGYGNNGDDNCMYGGHAGGTNSVTDSNVYMGNYCNALGGTGAPHTGSNNVYTGILSAEKNIGSYNCMLGAHAGQANANTYQNIFIGNFCNSQGTTGSYNVYAGAYAALKNTGEYNCMIGMNSGLSNAGTDSNVFMGYNSAKGMAAGENNVVMGFATASNTALSASNPSNDNVFIGGNGAANNPSGQYNITIGFGADAYSTMTGPPSIGPIYNSVAIGAEALVFDNDKFIIGNNEQDVGIGMSGLLGGGPQNKLEISVYSNIIGPTPCANPLINSTFNDASCGTGTPTGESGLQFRDLTYASVPFQNNPNSGFLTVDDVGNVVLMQQGAGGGGPGIGYCNALTSMADDGGYNLNNHNFYFAGNASTQLNQNNVYIGYNCQNPPAVVAKLDVLQNSLAQPASNTQPSIGAYIENDDLKNMGETSSYPVIGVKSYVPNTDAGTCTSIAGWFEAPQNNNCSYNYGIIVPKTEGGVALETQLHEELWMWREVCIMKVKPKFRLRVEELL